MQIVPLDTALDVLTHRREGCKLTYRGVVTDLGSMTLNDLEAALIRGQIGVVVEEL